MSRLTIRDEKAVYEWNTDIEYFDASDPGIRSDHP